MYNIAVRKCTSPPLLAPRLKIFKLKFTTPPGNEPEADMLPPEPARRAFMPKCRDNIYEIKDVLRNYLKKF